MDRSAIQQAIAKSKSRDRIPLDTILNSRSLPVRVKSRALASFVEEGGGMLIANILQFYTVAHRVNIFWRKGIFSSDFRPLYGEIHPVGHEPEDFVRKFSGHCSP